MGVSCVMMADLIAETAKLAYQIKGCRQRPGDRPGAGQDGAQDAPGSGRGLRER